MRFKEDHMVGQFFELNPFTLRLAAEFAFLSRTIAGVLPVVTRIKDTVVGESGVHPLGRAVDFRDEYLGKHTYGLEARNKLLHHFNTKYERSDNKKTLIHHGFRKGPEHFHLQTAYDLAVYKYLESPRHDKMIVCPVCKTEGGITWNLP